MRRFAPWALAVPLMLAGTEAAHVLAYRLVYPDAEVRWRVLAETGHGYLAWAPLLLGLGCALVCVSLLSELVDAARRRPPASVEPWAFALLPVVSFTVQELVERWLAVDRVPWWMFEQPTFRAGLLLQLPFGALAYLVARLLRGAARTAGARVFAGSAVPALVVAAASVPRPHPVTIRRLRTLTLGWGVRGPPILV